MGGKSGRRIRFCIEFLGGFGTSASCVLDLFSCGIISHIYISALVRWDPNREDKYLFDQSVVLYSNYYFLQIIVHRPFIPTPNKPSPSSFPSLAICANAARSCSHLADLQRKRTMLAPITQVSWVLRHPLIRSLLN